MTDTITIARAALDGNPTKLAALLKARADEFFKSELNDIVSISPIGQVTPLICAARSGSKACVELLLNAGAKLQFHPKDYREALSYTPLTHGLASCNTDTRLIMSPLHHAFGGDLFNLFLEHAIHEHDQTQSVGTRFYEQPINVFKLMFSLAKFAIWFTKKNIAPLDYEKMHAQGQAMMQQLNATVKRDTSKDGNDFIHTFIVQSGMAFISAWSDPKITTDQHNHHRHFIVKGVSKHVLTKHIDDALVLLMRMGLLPNPLLPNANITPLILRAAIQGFDNTAQFLRIRFPKAAQEALASPPMTYAELSWLYEKTTFPSNLPKITTLHDYAKTPLPQPTEVQLTAGASTTPVNPSSSVEEQAEKVALQQRVAMLEGELSHMRVQMAQVLSTLASLSASATPTYSSSMGPSSSSMVMSHQHPAPYYNPPYTMPHGYPIPNHYLAPSSHLYPVPGALPATQASWPPPQSPSYISAGYAIASAPPADTETSAPPALSNNSAPVPALSETPQNLWYTVPTSFPAVPASMPALDPLPHREPVTPDLPLATAASSTPTPDHSPTAALTV